MVSSTKLLIGTILLLVEGMIGYFSFGVRSDYSLGMCFKSVGVFMDISASSGLVKAYFYGVLVLLFIESILCLC